MGAVVNAKASVLSYCGLALASVAVFVLVSTASAIGSATPVINFEDAPRATAAAFPQLSSRLVRAQIREITSVKQAGRRYVLYAAPTTVRSFCSWWKASAGGFGACRSSRPGLQVQGFGPRARTLLTGSFDQTDVVRVAMTFTDRKQEKVPFVWVTKPIAAGLFVIGIAKADQTLTHQPVAVALYGRNGKLIESLPLP